MATIYQLKPAFQNLLRPLVRRMAAAGVTANQVTVAAALLSIACGAAVALRPEESWPLLLLPAALLARMALNAIDGMLAREFGMKSALGAILNELGDVVSDAALYLPLARVAGFPAAWVAGVVLLGVISEMTGVVAVGIGASRRYDGPCGKSDRAFLFGLMALLAGLGVSPQPWAGYALMVIAALSALTIFNRARGALKEAGR